MKIRHIIFSIIPIILVIALILPACSEKENPKNGHNTLTKQQIEEGWKLLLMEILLMGGSIIYQIPGRLWTAQSPL